MKNRINFNESVSFINLKNRVYEEGNFIDRNRVSLTRILIDNAINKNKYDWILINEGLLDYKIAFNKKNKISGNFNVALNGEEFQQLQIIQENIKEALSLSVIQRRLLFELLLFSFLQDMNSTEMKYEVVNNFNPESISLELGDYVSKLIKAYIVLGSNNENVVKILDLLNDLEDTGY